MPLKNVDFQGFKCAIERRRRLIINTHKSKCMLCTYASACVCGELFSQQINSLLSAENAVRRARIERADNF
jgi:hypothetical protein